MSRYRRKYPIIKNKDVYYDEFVPKPGQTYKRHDLCDLSPKKFDMMLEIMGLSDAHAATVFNVAHPDEPVHRRSILRWCTTSNPQFRVAQFFLDKFMLFERDAGYSDKFIRSLFD